VTRDQLAGATLGLGATPLVVGALDRRPRFAAADRRGLSAV
jgi:hypothetical protein